MGLFYREAEYSFAIWVERYQMVLDKVWISWAYAWLVTVIEVTCDQSVVMSCRRKAKLATIVACISVRVSFRF